MWEGEWIKNSEFNYFLLMYRLFQLLGIWGIGANPFLFIEHIVFVQPVQTGYVALQLRRLRFKGDLQRYINTSYYYVNFMSIICVRGRDMQTLHHVYVKPVALYPINWYYGMYLYVCDDVSSIIFLI